MSNALEVGKRLVELCRAGKNLEAVDTLYSPEIVCIEPQDFPGMPARMAGIAAVRGKNQWWLDNHEVHSSELRGPYPHGDRFTVWMSYEITPKVGPMAGKRMKMEETGLYTVKAGKIVQEEYFYDMSHG